MGFEDEVNNLSGDLAVHLTAGSSARTNPPHTRPCYELLSTTRLSMSLPVSLFSSLIGHSGSSAFRLSTTPVSMSLAGSRFSPDSAPRPFHHGFRRRGGT